MTIQERINELLQDKAFAEAFANVTGPQEVVDLFGKNGIEVPYEIAEELFKQDEEELNEDALDEVAGGGVFSTAGSVVFYGAGYLGARLAGWDKKKSKKYAKNCATVGKIIGGALDWATGV